MDSEGEKNAYGDFLIGNQYVHHLPNSEAISSTEESLTASSLLVTALQMLGESATVYAQDKFASDSIERRLLCLAEAFGGKNQQVLRAIKTFINQGNATGYNASETEGWEIVTGKRLLHPSNLRMSCKSYAQMVERMGVGRVGGAVNFELENFGNFSKAQEHEDADPKDVHGEIGRDLECCQGSCCSEWMIAATPSCAFRLAFELKKYAFGAIEDHRFYRDSDAILDVVLLHQTLITLGMWYCTRLRNSLESYIPKILSKIYEYKRECVVQLVVYADFEKAVSNLRVISHFSALVEKYKKHTNCIYGIETMLVTELLTTSQFFSSSPQTTFLNNSPVEISSMVSDVGNLLVKEVFGVLADIEDYFYREQLLLAHKQVASVLESMDRPTGGGAVPLTTLNQEPSAASPRTTNSSTDVATATTTTTATITATLPKSKKLLRLRKKCIDRLMTSTALLELSSNNTDIIRTNGDVLHIYKWWLQFLKKEEL